MVNIVVRPLRALFLLLASAFGAVVLVLSLLVPSSAYAETPELPETVAPASYLNPDGSPAPDPNRPDIPQAVQDAEAIANGEGELQIQTRSLNSVASRPTFNPGRIIDDEVFFNHNTMTAAQIQTFLNQRLPNGCLPTEKCLRNYKQTTKTIPADRFCGAYQGAANESAATIIYKVAKACKVNPQVLLVTMQKEQSLVTLKNPSNGRYNAAMGMACPDTSPCDPAYANFFGQIYGGARQFQVYANDTKYFSWYPVGKRSTIFYNFDKSCGSTSVLIENKATAGLYYYTPYQPNAAALAAGYGTGDRCSAHGNRDFFYLFNDWFGPTTIGGDVSAPSGPCVVSGKVSSKSGLYRVAGTGLGYVNVRKAPNTDCTVGVVRLSDNALIEVTGMRGSWMRVRNNGSEAWIHSDYLISAAVLGNANFAKGRNVMALDTHGHLWGYPIGSNGSWENKYLLRPEKLSFERVIPLGDVTADGYPDALGISAGGAVSLLKGNRTYFDAPVSLGESWPNTQVTSAGDFDGDGALDVFVLEQKTGALHLKTLTRTGDSWSFSRSRQVGNGWGGFNLISGGSSMTVGGVGTVSELIARRGDGQLFSYRGNGKGGWLEPLRIGWGWSGFTQIYSPGDINNDGHRDIFGVDSDGMKIFYRGVDNGLISRTESKYSDWDLWRSMALSPMVSTTSVQPTPGVKKTRELLALTKSGEVIKYPFTAQGTFTGPYPQLARGWPTRFPKHSVIRLGDFDSDGREDFARVEADGKLSFVAGKADGTLDAPKQIGQGWGVLKAIFGGYDFDGDGKRDILIVREQGQVEYIRGDGAGKFSGNFVVLPQLNWGKYETIISAGDFNGDGYDDLIATDGGGNLFLLSGTRNSFAPQAKQIGNGWGGLSLIGPGDFNGDGNADVLTIWPDGALKLYAGDGRGGWGVTGRQVGQGWGHFVSVQ